MRIAIVNDLRIAQEVLRHAVGKIPGATVAWLAFDGQEALAKCRADRPDLILMDMVMPVMDGAVTTRAIMKHCPCPILVVTSTIEGNLALVYEALSAGAIDAVQTPTVGPSGSVLGVEALARKAAIAVAASASHISAKVAPPLAPLKFDVNRMPAGTGVPLVAIGSSTGGPHALSVVLRAMTGAPPCCTVIVQHIDIAYAPGLAQWLTGEIKRPVTVAKDGDSLCAGAIFIASTTDHLIIRSRFLRYVAEPVEQIFRPSVDALFESIVHDQVPSSVAILLTGMGRDGAHGLRLLRDAGWHTIAQNEASSVVWGMPGSAVAMGAAKEVLALDEIGAAADRALRSASSRTRSSL